MTVFVVVLEDRHIDDQITVHAIALGADAYHEYQSQSGCRSTGGRVVADGSADGGWRCAR
jgi:hypothetical protein